METIKFECEVITPMFLGGADGKSAELRAPSIKGALRFWWRAMNGHLPLKDLHEREAEIFGGGGDKGKRSQVIVMVSGDEFTSALSKLVPHRDTRGYAIPIGYKFNVELALLHPIFSKENELLMNLDILKNLFKSVSFIGGLGKRSRRGMGAFRIVKIKEKGQETLFKLESLVEIQQALNSINKNTFSIQSERILTRFNNKNQFPFIKSVRVGIADSNLLLKISKATHDLHEQYGREYDNAMGKARGGRLSSPVYVSLVYMNNTIKPIISVLNTVHEHNTFVQYPIQEEFIGRLL